MASEDVFQIFKIVDRAVGQVKNNWPSDHASRLIAAVGCRWLGGFKVFGDNDRIRAFGESVDLSGDFAVRLAWSFGRLAHLGYSSDSRDLLRLAHWREKYDLAAAASLGVWEWSWEGAQLSGPVCRHARSLATSSMESVSATQTARSAGEPVILLRHVNS